MSLAYFSNVAMITGVMVGFSSVGTISKCERTGKYGT